MSTQELLGGKVFAPGQTTGQRVFSIIGAVVGAYVGGPQGAIMGYQLSAQMPGMLDPVNEEADHGEAEKA